MAQKKKSIKEGLKEDFKLWTKGAKVGAAVAVNLIPTAKAAKTVSKIASRTKAKKITSGEPTIKKKTFTQGDRARITNTPPKKTGAGKNSPVKGTKVEVSYKTKKISPETYAMLTTGRTAREGSKKVGTYLKGAATGAAGFYTVSELKKARDKKEAEKKKKGK
jgi:hypothetical protein